MYRQTDDRKVWYEWMVEVFVLERRSVSVNKRATPVMSGAQSISNSAESLKIKENDLGRAGYRRVRVGISDLHSSIKDGCLM